MINISIFAFTTLICTVLVCCAVAMIATVRAEKVCRKFDKQSKILRSLLESEAAQDLRLDKHNGTLQDLQKFDGAQEDRLSHQGSLLAKFAENLNKYEIELTQLKDKQLTNAERMEDINDNFLQSFKALELKKIDEVYGMISSINSLELHPRLSAVESALNAASMQLKITPTFNIKPTEYDAKGKRVVR